MPTSLRPLAVALLAVAACTDPNPVSLRDRSPAVSPIETDAGAPIALFQANGSLPASGSILWREFLPENPPLGSTVVATFVYLGSSNIITSVTDYLTSGALVGNPYHLVEYVTSGGYSLATYVATNVQGYPYPKPSGDKVLLVQANLSRSVSVGGAMLSVFTGVNPEFSQALGAHRSAFGSGSSPTVASPGPISINANALAYGVSLSSAGLVGMAPPPGFTKIETLADDAMQFDMEYTVRPDGGPVEPQWTWTFGAPSIWLASSLTLNSTAGGPPPNQPPTAAFDFSCTDLTCVFTSRSSDPDGSIAAYSWDFGDSASSTAQNPSHTYGADSSYTVTLTVPDNQGATASASHTVTVGGPNQAPTANFTFSCNALACAFTSTSSDPDGTIATHSWTFGDGATSTGPNPSHTYAVAGTYSVTLTVTDNRGAASTPVSKTVAVNQPPPPATHLVFTVQPTSTTAGSILSPPIRVAALDNGGATVPNFTGTITIALGSNPGGATLSGTRSVAAVNGVATFSDLRIDRAGSGYTLAATSPGLSGAASTAFDITTPGGGGGPIALDQKNGTFGGGPAMLLAKGFNPTNPHRGDAIIATFFWIGSSNVITRVYDRLTNGTAVGNTYNLIDYVTSGGISMATYLATSVQSFPDPNVDQNDILVVVADLSVQVPNAGIMISAYSGVHPVASQVVSDAVSASGTGSTTTTTALPRPAAVAAGGLVYGVSMSNNVVGVSRPAGYELILPLSNDVMVEDGEYAVQPNAGTADLQWTWFFTSPATWLATVLSLRPAP